MAKAAITTPIAAPDGASSAPSRRHAAGLDQRRLDPLAPHDLMGHVARDAVGDVGDIGRAEQRAPAALAVAHEQIGAGGIVDGRIGEQVDPQPRRAARHQHQIEAVVMVGDFGEHRLELGLEQVEPGDLAVAMVGRQVEALGLVEARLADGLAQRPRRGRPAYGFDAFFHPSSLGFGTEHSALKGGNATEIRSATSRRARPRRERRRTICRSPCRYWPRGPTSRWRWWRQAPPRWRRRSPRG